MFKGPAEKVLKNTTLLSVIHPDDQKEHAGTAFLVDNKKGYLLTCHHVVNGAKDGEAGVMRIEAPYDPQPFDVLASNKTKDLAILKLRNPPSYLKSYPALRVDTESDHFGLGRSVATCGFPEPWILKKPFVTAGIVSSIVHPKKGEPIRFTMNVSTMHGNSGGAVFTPEGYLVGMVQKTTFVEEKFPLPYTTCLHVSEIFSAIRSARLDLGWRVPSQQELG
jgi:S1-C subfamily serine protease